MFQTSIPLYNSRTPSHKLSYLCWTSRTPSSDSNIATFVYYKETDTHNYLHYTLLTLSTVKTASRTANFYAYAVSALMTTTLLSNAFFETRGYPSQLLVTIEKGCPLLAARKHFRNVTDPVSEERMPLVLTYHPLSSRIKHILINNSHISCRECHLLYIAHTGIVYVNALANTYIWCLAHSLFLFDYTSSVSRTLFSVSLLHLVSRALCFAVRLLRPVSRVLCFSV